MAHRVYSIQHGSTPDFNVSEQNKWYVIEETWEDGKMLNQTIKAKVDTEAEAAESRKAFIATYKAAAALGRLGGSVSSDAKTRAAKANIAKRWHKE